MRYPSTRSLLLLSILLVQGCATYEFESQRVLLHHDADADSIELFVVTRGIYKPGESGARKAASLLRKVELGYRHVLLGGWYGELDFDDPPEAEDPLQGAFRAWSKGVSVVTSELLRTSDEKVVLKQRLVLGEARKLVALVNLFIDQELLDETPGDGAAPYQVQALLAWQEAARGEHEWLRFVDGTLVLSIPCTDEVASRSLAELLGSRPETRAFWSRVLEVADLRLTGEQAVLTFRPREDGWITLPSNWSQDAQYDPGVYRRLREERELEVAGESDLSPPPRRPEGVGEDRR